jgi:hypothetical protein
LVDVSHPFHEEPRAPEPRIEAWLPYLVAALFVLALALILSDAFLLWTEDTVKAANPGK